MKLLKNSFLLFVSYNSLIKSSLSYNIIDYNKNLLRASTRFYSNSLLSSSTSISTSTSIYTSSYFESVVIRKKMPKGVKRNSLDNDENRKKLKNNDENNDEIIDENSNDILEKNGNGKRNGKKELIADSTWLIREENSKQKSLYQFPSSTNSTTNSTSTTSPLFKILSWNVNGLRAILSSPSKASSFSSLITTHLPDVICLQETKIQDNHIKDVLAMGLPLPDGGNESEFLGDYHKVWNCATAKKGYASTAVFLRKNLFDLDPSVEKYFDSSLNGGSSAPASTKQKSLKDMWNKPKKSTEEETSSKSNNTTSTSLLSSLPSTSSAKKFTVKNVIIDIPKKYGNDLAEKEGRIITIEFDKFFLINSYIPNSGEGLARLDFRVKKWDQAMYSFLKDLHKQKPVIWTGDLNVGHLDIDIHNPDAKHILTQAGLTKEERESFDNFLKEKIFHDAFRHFYPNSKGQFTYWSARTNARPVNKGIRLDYFICSKDFFENERKEEGETSEESDRNSITIIDSDIEHKLTEGSSDHCPVWLVLKY